jgi:thioredoxin-like negative regulator of GroEL
MNTLILVLALAILVILVYRVWEPFVDTPKQQVPVGSANLYFFYTDWCGFSQKAMPEWEKLEQRLKETPVFGKTKVTPVRVNADEDRKTAQLYEIDAYPMIKLETSSLLSEFSGPRTAEGLVQFLRNTLGKERESL